jgi:hypothetical protein
MRRDRQPSGDHGPMFIVITAEQVLVEPVVQSLREDQLPRAVYGWEFSHRSTLHSLSNAVSVPGSRRFERREI